MLFNSLEFTFFLPIVFLIYWFVLQKNLKLQNLFIIIVSYIFYKWWDYRFLFLIALTSFCSWYSGVLIGKFQGKAEQNIAEATPNAEGKTKQSISKIILVSNIVLNLAILGFFKYYNFFVDSFIDLFKLFNVTLQPSNLNIILPVGISFYTFQALSYSIDVYRKKIEPTNDIVAFFAFVSFFPQLVAGPIERTTNLLPQFYKSRKFDYDTAVDGMRQILWGLFKRIVVADNCAIYVNEVFADYTSQSGSTLLLGAIFFAFQIYGDFSGYSDIAIGTAKLFGIKLLRNFNVLYFSCDIAEFWRRWHISLNTWFVDYLYIPLGGSRPYVNPESKHTELTKKAKVIRNTFAIFLTSGLWHGANWTFVAWGAYHALLFIPLILLGKNKRFTDTVATGRILPNIKESIQMLSTFILVVIGWIFFRAESITDAFAYLDGIFDKSLLSAPNLINRDYYIITFIGIITMLFVEWLSRKNEHNLTLSSVKYVCVRWIIYLVFIFMLFINSSPAADFIYFQF